MHESSLKGSGDLLIEALRSAIGFFAPCVGEAVQKVSGFGIDDRIG